MSQHRKLENPFPHFAEATEAASRIYSAQKEYLALSAELRARREARRAAFLAGALLFVGITVTLTLFWVTMAIHEEGLAAGWLALISFVFFGAVSGALAYLGIQAGKAPAKAEHDTIRKAAA